MPELAFGYFLGWIPNLLLTGLHLFLFQKRIRSVENTRLQLNLSKLSLFWSESEGSLIPLEDESLEKDKRKYRRSAILLGAFCLFLSWLGFFAQLMIMASLRYLAVSRLEKRLRCSKLAQQELGIAEIDSELKSIRSFV